MLIGERIIEGEIHEKEEAKKRFERAKANGQKASLVSQERPNLYTTELANIGPQEAITVVIEYQQMVAYDQGDFSIHFPLTLTPRYIPGSTFFFNTPSEEGLNDLKVVTDVSRITPPINNTVKNPVSLTLDLHTGFDLSKLRSPYHEVTVKTLGQGHQRIRLLGGKTMADKDFELTWTPTAATKPRVVAFQQKWQGEHYGMLMVLSPQESLSLKRILPREVIFVLDTSGSMYGESIRQAKSAVNYALDQLSPKDSFNIVEFNSDYSTLSNEVLDVNPTNIAKAKQFTHQLKADGGTEIAKALHYVFNQARKTEKLRQVIFLTDGSVGNEAMLLSMIHNGLGQSRLYTIGIGSAPNRYFMQEAATKGRGTFTYIGNVHEVKEKMSSMLQKLKHPVMQDIQLVSDLDTQWFPNPMKDLYLGEPVIATFQGNSPLKSFVVSGNLGQSIWKETIPVSAVKKESGLHVLWAQDKVKHIHQQAQLGQLEMEQAKEQIIELGLNHHIVTPFTSLLAVEQTPSRPLDEMAQDKRFANMKPAGSHLQMPKTATQSQFHLLIGLLMLLVSVCIWWFTQPRSNQKSIKIQEV